MQAAVATRLARRGIGLGAGGRRSRLGFTAQTFELRTQCGFVLGQRFLEQAALVCVHGLGLDAVGPGLEPGQLEVDLLDLGLAQRDLAVLALQQCVALGQRLVTLGQLLRRILYLLLQLRNQRGDLGRQTLRISGWETTHAKHAWHRARAGQRGPLAHALSTDPRSTCLQTHARVMLQSSGRRCHGRPGTRASNCAAVSARDGVTPATTGQTKRPAFRRRVAHHTPKPS